MRNALVLIVLALVCAGCGNKLKGRYVNESNPDEFIIFFRGGKCTFNIGFENAGGVQDASYVNEDGKISISWSRTYLPIRSYNQVGPAGDAYSKDYSAVGSVDDNGNVILNGSTFIRPRATLQGK